jgi:hypothetical protein
MQTKLLTHRELKKAIQVETNVRSILIMFSDIKGIVHKEFVLAGQTVNSSYRATVSFYGDCLKTCEDFAPIFGCKRTGCGITTTYRLTFPFCTREFSTKNKMTIVPHPPYFFLFPQFEIQLKYHHFDTVEMV